jgi:hypothetical protein
MDLGREIINHVIGIRAIKQNKRNWNIRQEVPRGLGCSQRSISPNAWV